MYNVKKIVLCFILCALILSLCACGKKSEDQAVIYEETIGGLEDNELFAIIDTNAPLPVYLLRHKCLITAQENRLHLHVTYIIQQTRK